jgi:hypothetical protein
MNIGTHRLLNYRFAAQAATAALALLTATHAAALTTFTAGTPAKASEVNDNFAELDGRITALEAQHTGDTVAVDCSGDANALNTALASASGGDTLVITGTCAGPVRVRPSGITLQAATPGVDGISSAGNDDPVLFVMGQRATVDGLLLNATVASGSTGLFVARAASATADNLYVTGATNSAIAGRAGSLQIRNTTNIDSLLAVDGGAVRILSGNGGFMLGAYRNGTIEIHRDAAGSSFATIEAADGGQVRSRDAGTNITVNGQLGVYRTSSMRFQGPVTVNYDPGPGENAGVLVLENSSLRLEGATINAYTEVVGASGLRAFSTHFREFGDPGSGAYLYAGLSSALVLHGGSVGAIEVAEKSSAYLQSVTVSGMAYDGGTYALEIDAAYLGTENGTTIQDNVYVDSNGVLEIEGSTLTGNLNLYQNSSASVEDASTIVATRASGGTCPSNYDDGIRLHLGSMMTVRDAASSITGYLETGRFSAFEAWEHASLPNVDADQSTFDALNVQTGVSVCTP